MAKQEEIYTAIDLENSLKVHAFKSLKSLREFVGVNDKFFDKKSFPINHNMFWIDKSVLLRTNRRGTFER